MLLGRNSVAPPVFNPTPGPDRSRVTHDVVGRRPAKVVLEDAPMRLFMTLALGLAVTALVAGDSFAQQPGQPGRRGGQGQPGGGRGGMGGGMFNNPAMLLANENVAKELNLTDEQKEKVKAARDKMTEKMREAFQGGGQPDREKMQAMMKELNEESTKMLGDTLKPEQSKRLKEISYQAMGAAAFANADVQKELKITDEQKEKLTAIQNDVQKERRELMQGGNARDPETQKKLTALTKDANEKAMAVLTDEQKKSWKDMTGTPVTYSLQQGMGGGRRPGAGGGARPPRIDD